MINLAVVNDIFPNVMLTSLFEDRSAPMANPARAKRAPYKQYGLAFKYEVLAAWDNSNGRSKLDVAESFDIEQKAIDHFIAQRRRGKI